jgi:hypothetical protein
VIDSASHRFDRTAVRRRPFSSTSKLALLAWSIPCSIALVYLGVFLARFGHNIWLLGWMSDYAFAFVAPQSLASAGIVGHTNLGTYGSYVPLWFGLLTAWMPLHRELWQLAPTALYLAAAGAVGWSVAQIANRRAAALAMLLALVASPWAWGVFMAPDAHNVVYPCTALLGGYLVWLARGEERRRATAVAGPLAIGVVLGTCFASDDLLLTTGLLPLFLTAILAGARRERRSKVVALSALASVVVALPVAWLTSTIMAALGFETEAQSLGLTPLSLLREHTELLKEGLKILFNGYLGGATPVGTVADGFLHAQLGTACYVLMLVTLGALLLAGIRSGVNFMLPRKRRDGTPRSTDLARDLHVVYWVSSAAMACGAYAFSNFLDAYHESFYATTILSVAAVVPLFAYAHSPLRWLVPVGASIFFLASAVGVTNYYVAPINTSLIKYDSQILRLARENHVNVGYTGWWGASSMTWSVGESVKIRPIHWCPGAEGVRLCRFPHGTVGSWYVPRPRHTFLVVEPNQFASTSITVLPRGLGRPLAAYAIGPVQMYVYPYDIASRVGPPFG